MKLTLIILIILVMLLGLRAIENSFLYHPITHPAPLTMIESPELKAKIKDVYFTTPKGIRLNGWYIAGDPHKPTILFAHGNWGNMGYNQLVAKEFTQAGYPFMTFDYRGYGNSAGKPSEKGLYEDFEAASDYLAKTYHVDSREQIAVGNSLGGAVVIDAASRKPFKAVIVYSTFTSTAEMAKHLQSQKKLGMLNRLPIENLIRQRFDSIDKISKIKSPLLIAHGDADTYVPATMSEALFNKATTPIKRYLVVPGANHLDAFSIGHKELLFALSEMLSQ